MVNKYCKRSKISESKFRQILKYFAMDFSASQTAVADIERGAITNPRVATLVKLAQALELNSKETADLMGVNTYKEEK